MNHVLNYLKSKTAAIRDKDLELEPNPEDKEVSDNLTTYSKERSRYDLRKPKLIQTDIKEAFMGFEDKSKSMGFKVVEDHNSNSLYVHTIAFFSVDVDSEVDHYITPETEQYVNTNGDAWERRFVLKIFGRDFPGAFNFEEHIQIPRLNRGRVVDTFAKLLDNTIQVDVLIRVDDSIVIDDVLMGRYKSVSIGCAYKFATCTQCGTQFAPDDERCVCIETNLKGHFYDNNGIKRIVAELVGHRDDEDSAQLYECSWVQHPAFKGADVQRILKVAGKTIRLSDIFTFSNVVNISLIMPKIRDAPFREKLFLLAASYYVLSSDLSQWQKVALMIALSKMEAPRTLISVPLYLAKLTAVAGPVVGIVKLKEIFSNVQIYLRTH